MVELEHNSCCSSDDQNVNSANDSFSLLSEDVEIIKAEFDLDSSSTLNRKRLKAIELNQVHNQWLRKTIKPSMLA
jgi:hypothetical protein